MNNRDEERLIAETLNKFKDAINSGKSEPTVVRCDYELGTDQAEDPAVFVTVLLDDSWRDEDWTLERMLLLENQVRSTLWSAGVSRWAYVRFLRPKDVKAAG